MSDDGDGIYTITLQFPPNSAQEYKFLGNGDWGIANCSTVLSPAPRVQAVHQPCGASSGESIVLDTVCYNLCEACAPGCTNDTVTTTTLPTWTTALVSTWLPASCPTAATTAKALSWVVLQRLR